LLHFPCSILSFLLLFFHVSLIWIILS
jgi:hypothetical protein